MWRVGAGVCLRGLLGICAAERGFDLGADAERLFSAVALCGGNLLCPIVSARLLWPYSLLTGGRWATAIAAACGGFVRLWWVS